MLENSAAAAIREIEDRLRPSLEDKALTALQSLLQLHGPLLLATRDGRELYEQAERLRMTRDEQIALRVEAEALVTSLHGVPDLVEPHAVDIVAEATNVIGRGQFPERGTVFGIAAIANITAVMISAAALASLIPIGIAVGGVLGGVTGTTVAWTGYESLKKSRMFSGAATVLGAKWDKFFEAAQAGSSSSHIKTLAEIRRFVVSCDGKLRRLAAMTHQFRSLLPHLEFIARTNTSYDEVKGQKTLTSERRVVIRNRGGLGAIQAARLCRLASKFEAEITITKRDTTVSARSIIGLLMLSAGRDTVLKLRATGSDAEEAVTAIDALIHLGFGES